LEGFLRVLRFPGWLEGRKNWGYQGGLVKEPTSWGFFFSGKGGGSFGLWKGLILRDILERKGGSHLGITLLIWEF